MTSKSRHIPKTLVWEAWLHCDRQEALAIDETIERFETKLAANLDRIG